MAPAEHWGILIVMRFRSFKWKRWSFLAGAELLETMISDILQPLGETCLCTCGNKDGLLAIVFLWAMLAMGCITCANQPGHWHARGHLTSCDRTELPGGPNTTQSKLLQTLQRKKKKRRMNTYENTEIGFICLKLKAALLAPPCCTKTGPELQKLLFLSPLSHLGWEVGFLKQSFTHLRLLLSIPALGREQQPPGGEASMRVGCFAPCQAGREEDAKAVDTMVRTVTEPELDKDIGSSDSKKSQNKACSIQKVFWLSNCWLQCSGRLPKLNHMEQVTLQSADKL